MVERIKLFVLICLFGFSSACADDFVIENAMLPDNYVQKNGATLNFDTTSAKHEWNTLLIYPNTYIENGKIASISFDYKTDKPNQIDEVWALMECEKDGKRVSLGRVVISDLRKGHAKLSTYIPMGSKKAAFKLTSRGKVVFEISNFKFNLSEPNNRAAENLSKYNFIGLRHTPLDAHFLGENSWAYNVLESDNFFPFVDKYGQFKHREWKDKIHSDEDLITRIDEEKIFEKNLCPIENRGEKYLGLIDTSAKYPDSPRFRTVKRDGKWFFITPDGNLFWSLGIDSVGVYTTTPTERREFYFEDIDDVAYKSRSGWGKFEYEMPHDTFSHNRRNIVKKYGNDVLDNYWKISNRRMRKWGFNSYGSWGNSKTVLPHANLPYSVFIQVPKLKKIDSESPMYAYWTDCADYYDPEFPKLMDKNVANVAKLLSSPLCFGVYIGNELPWQSKIGDTAKGIISSPANQPAKIEAMKILRKKYLSIKKLNEAWGSDFSKWSEFLSERKFFPKTKESESDMLLIEKSFYNRFFSVCRDSIKKYDENLLYMGCRFAWRNDLVVQSASKYCDVISFNAYRNNLDDMMLPKGCEDKPVIIGEFTFGTLDRGHFSGGGQRTRNTISEKADAFYNYVKSALKNPEIIGVNWFEWFDEPISARSDGENFSLGFVDVADTPYYEMAIACNKISRKIYNICIAK